MPTKDALLAGKNDLLETGVGLQICKLAVETQKEYAELVSKDPQMFGESTDEIGLRLGNLATHQYKYTTQREIADSILYLIKNDVPEDARPLLKSVSDKLEVMDYGFDKDNPESVPLKDLYKVLDTALEQTAKPAEEQEEGSLLERVSRVISAGENVGEEPAAETIAEASKIDAKQHLEAAKEELGDPVVSKVLGKTAVPGYDTRVQLRRTIDKLNGAIGLSEDGSDPAKLEKESKTLAKIASNFEEKINDNVKMLKKECGKGEVKDALNLLELARNHFIIAEAVAEGPKTEDELAALGDPVVPALAAVAVKPEAEHKGINWIKGHLDIKGGINTIKSTLQSRKSKGAETNALPAAETEQTETEPGNEGAVNVETPETGETPIEEVAPEVTEEPPAVTHKYLSEEWDTLDTDGKIAKLTELYGEPSDKLRYDGDKKVKRDWIVWEALPYATGLLTRISDAADRAHCQKMIDTLNSWKKTPPIVDEAVLVYLELKSLARNYDTMLSPESKDLVSDSVDEMNEALAAIPKAMEGGIDEEQKKKFNAIRALMFRRIEEEYDVEKLRFVKDHPSDFAALLKEKYRPPAGPRFGDVLVVALDRLDESKANPDNKQLEWLEAVLGDERLRAPISALLSKIDKAILLHTTSYSRLAVPSPVLMPPEPEATSQGAAPATVEGTAPATLEEETKNPEIPGGSEVATEEE
jgi:hypothetical protein